MFILFLSLSAGMARPETVSAQVDVSVQIKDHNLFAARNEAIARAFSTAVYRTSVGILPAAGGGGGAETMIQERVVAHAADFVASYKFLSETIDYAQETMTVSMEVAVYADMIWSRLKEGGAVAGGRKGKKLVVLIQEESLSFMAKSDSLLLASMSEEVAAQTFRRNGFHVATRKEVRSAGLSALAMKALDGEAAATVKIGAALEADFLLFGKTAIKTITAPQGEKAFATIKATLHRASDGAAIATREETGEAEPGGGAKGSMEAIQAAAAGMAREIMAKGGLAAE